MTNKIKNYICKKCGFSGIRPTVRKHVKEEHMIGRRVNKFMNMGDKHKSEITPQIKVVDLE